MGSSYKFWNLFLLLQNPLQTQGYFEHMKDFYVEPKLDEKEIYCNLCPILQQSNAIKPIRTKSKEELEFLWSKNDCW